MLQLPYQPLNTGYIVFSSKPLRLSFLSDCPWHRTIPCCIHRSPAWSCLKCLLTNHLPCVPCFHVDLQSTKFSNVELSKRLWSSKTSRRTRTYCPFGSKLSGALNKKLVFIELTRSDGKARSNNRRGRGRGRKIWVSLLLPSTKVQKTITSNMRKKRVLNSSTLKNAP